MIWMWVLEDGDLLGSHLCTPSAYHLAVVSCLYLWIQLYHAIPCTTYAAALHYTVERGAWK